MTMRSATASLRIAVRFEPCDDCTDEDLCENWNRCSQRMAVLPLNEPNEDLWPAPTV